MMNPGFFILIRKIRSAIVCGKEINSQGYDIARGYISIKLGYRKIFSEESKTGFFVEPQSGYCRVVVVDDRYLEATYGDGVAAAIEAGTVLK